MAIIQVVSEEANRSVEDLLKTVQQIASRLAIPEELLHDHLDDKDDLLAPYRRQAEDALLVLRDETRRPEWDELDEAQRAKIVFDILRLDGDEPWSTPGIRQLVDELTSPLPASLFAHILTHLLRPLFASHPSVHPSTTRAVPRAPTLSDLDAPQPFKSPSAWGAHCVLASCSERVDVEAHLGVIVPPTLVLMDDHAPLYRERGASVLSTWLGRVDPPVLRRMGLDALLLRSLTHSLALNPAEPMRHVLRPALVLAARQEPEKRAATYATIIDRAVLSAWTYAPAGPEGRPALVAAAQHLVVLCETCGTGIARWLQPIVAGLLDPLQYPPSAVVLAHFSANLEALLAVLITLRGTGRAARWRGRILDVLARVWVQTHERLALEEDEADRRAYERVRTRACNVYREIETQCPLVRAVEFKTLLSLDADLFSPLVSPASA
ncbi:hypothetical protein Q5752_000362 [Cryptotrichosporon argae]